MTDNSLNSKYSHSQINSVVQKIITINKTVLFDETISIRLEM